MSFDPAWRLIAGSGQNLTVGAASVVSTNPFGPQTYAVRVTTKGDCHITFGTGTPVAVATDMMLKASDPGAIFRVSPGEKVAVIQDAASTGTFNVVELTH